MWPLRTTVIEIINHYKQCCHRKTRILFPFTPRAPAGEVRVGGKKEELFGLGTCTAAPLQQHVRNHKPTEKQHHNVPVRMLPLTLGPLANSTILELKMVSISFRQCNTAVGHCRKTEASKHFKG